ncbi:MAG: hypothetical protein IJM76_00225 [Lachnospiraceae bacterium]|nr:hypothetical protein [Lachnospiraceae bacterium]
MSRSIQFFLTPAAGKRLIAAAVVKRADVQEALQHGTIFVIGGTTNVFVANALLEALGSPLRAEFPSFHRGVAAPAGTEFIQAETQGDLLIEKGVPRFVNALPEICATLKAGDIIFKGANAVHLESRTAGVLIGNTETGGTIAEASRAVMSRRAALIHPAGVEKRVEKPVYELARLVNAADASGLRLHPSAGDIFTELDAIKLLFDADAEIISAGAVNGGEGGTYFQAAGGDLDGLLACVREIAKEPPVFC